MENRNSATLSESFTCACLASQSGSVTRFDHTRFVLSAERAELRIAIEVAQPHHRWHTDLAQAYAAPGAIREQFTEKTLAADVPLPAVRMLRYQRPVRTHLMVVGAVVAMGLATSCAETDPNRGAVGLAGAGTVGEANSANGGHGGAGGAGGDAASTDLSQGGTAGKCWELKAWSPDGCGTCEMTMDQYCAKVNCTPDPLPSCEGLPAAYSIDEGCGLLQLRMSGHGGAIYTESVYDLETRKLTFYYDKGGRSAGCMPELRVGIEPTCEGWTTLCEGAGGE